MSDHALSASPRAARIAWVIAVPGAVVAVEEGSEESFLAVMDASAPTVKTVTYDADEGDDGRGVSAEIDRPRARSASPKTLGGGGRWPPDEDVRLGGSSKSPPPLTREAMLARRAVRFTTNEDAAEDPSGWGLSPEALRAARACARRGAAWGAPGSPGEAPRD